MQICEMPDNHRMLGYYSVVSGMEIHVVDTDPFSLSRGGGLTDTSLIQKYTMADEDYDKRKGTVRDFIKEKRKNDPNYKVKPKSTPSTAAGAMGAEERAPAPGAESVEGIAVDMRCEVQPGARRGTVRFVGEIKEIKAGGHWVGEIFSMHDSLLFNCLVVGFRWVCSSTSRWATTTARSRACASSSAWTAMGRSCAATK